jgi:UDP-N-acetylmuramate--alanine ligase
MSKIFFSGIGGSGMSAIASFMAGRGHTIIGSDRSFDSNPDHPLSAMLKNKGITLVPHDGSGIESSLDLAVFSTAVEDTQPEVTKAKDLGIPMKTRPEFLSEIASEFRTIAVAGTSGKSTIAGMLAFVLHKLGLEPNFIGGGRVKQFKSQSNAGNSLNGASELLIIEACESDDSITHYHPVYSIISNLSLDHNVIEKTAEMFETLGRNTKEMVILNGDDENLKRCRFDKAITFSINNPSEYRAEAIAHQPLRTMFSLHGINYTLSLPGQYNLSNALPCIALLSEMGIPLKDIAGILPSFSGLDRRFDIHLNTEKHLVIDDYAHNPHKIFSLMGSLKSFRHRVCYIFQPHGFGPTRLMKHEYIDVFAKNLREEDHLVLLPIYDAGGTTLRDISSEDLSYAISEAGRSAEVLHERSLLLNRVKEWDTYIVFGARDETLADFAQEIALRVRDIE